MRKLFLLLLLTLAGISSMIAQSAVCYAVSENQANNQLYTYDPGTGAWSLTGATCTDNIEAIAFDPFNNILYATNADVLGTLDLSTGKFTAKTTFGAVNGDYDFDGAADDRLDIIDIDGLSYDPIAGILWASDRRGGTGNPDIIFQIDIATCNIVQNAFGPGEDYLTIPPVANPNTGAQLWDIDDIAWDPFNGYLYLIQNNGGLGDVLTYYNLSTQAITVVGLTNPDMEGLGFNHLEQLFGTTGNGGGNSFYSININTGAATILSNISTVHQDFESVDCLSTWSDLALDKKISSTQPMPIAAGDQVCFDVTIYNQGQVANTNIELTDYVPTGLTLNDANWIMSGGNATTTISGPLAPGAMTTIPVCFTVDAGFSGSITNTVEISGSHDTNGNALPDIDSNPDNTNNETNVQDNVINQSGPNFDEDEDDHDIATISVAAIPDCSLSSNSPICEGQNISLSENGGDAETWSWSGPNGFTSSNQNPTISNATTAASGIYTVTITEKGVSNTCSVDVIVHPSPTVTLAAAGPFCTNASSATLDGAPTGGTYSGTGITSASAGTFDPSSAGVGTHTITYSFTDANGCTGSATRDIVVTQQPSVSLPSAGPLCISEPSITLNGMPSGGTYSGTGITNATNGVFDPATAGAGTHTVTYTYSDGNGCSGSATTDIVVNTPPTVTLSPAGPFCADDNPLNLVGAPAGGTFSGMGITDGSVGSFDPGVAGVGTHTVTYSFTDANGCTHTDSKNIVVNGIPNVTADPAGPFCLDDASATLAGSPTGGSWSGTGITGASTGTFNPAVAGVGSHTITYTLVDANGCESSDEVTIVVNPLPMVMLAPAGPLCSSSDAVTLNGTPSGGTFSGTGITSASAGTFDPTTAGVGTHTITYVYADANGCEAETAIDIVVNAGPTVTIDAAGPFCVDESDVTLSANPTGGLWSGMGITNSIAGTFSPSAATVGTHTISYTYTDPNGCEASTTTDIVVNPLPTIEAGAAVCSADLSTYSIDITTTANSATSTLGTVTDNGGGSFTVSSIPAGSNIIITATDTNTGCSEMLAVTSPDCTCPPIVAPSDADPQSFCEGDANVALTVTVPAGMTADWWDSLTGGTLVATNTTSFTPTVTAAGMYTYYVEAKDPNNGCVSSPRLPIDYTIYPSPEVMLSDAGPFCDGDAAEDLAGVPAGGQYSGDGITDASEGTFDPATAGIGTHTVTYTYTDANGCSNSDEIDITVNPGPTVSITPAGPFCIDDDATNLVGSPAGGMWSGMGITDGTSGQFDPAVATAGTHTITYTFTDANGCSGNNTIDIVVNPLPLIDITPVGPYCVNDDSENITVSPAGGTWSGTGITDPSAGTFSPGGAGVGTHTLTYVVTDANGCENSASIEVRVNPLPSVMANPAGPFCVGDVSEDLLASPAGGTWTGTGITDGSAGTFDPATAGVGTHTITYDYVDANGCANTTTIDIIVNPGPVVNIDPAGPFCISDDAVTLIATPAGGTWSGMGITDASTGDFDPTAAGVGTHTITYMFADANGCDATGDVDIVVNEDPVIAAEAPACSADLSNYSVDVTTTGDAVTSTAGTVTDNGGGSFTISAVTTGTDITITAIITASGCQVTLDITAPDCTCDEVNAPVNPSNPTICEGEAIPDLSAEVGGGETIDWYDSSSGGNLLLASSLTYGPTGSFSAGTYTFYAEARNMATDCVSSSRTPVVMQINPLPVVTIDPAGPYCVEAGAVTITASPAGGTFSGTGITDATAGTFESSVAGVGTHTITYSFTDGNGCTNTSTTDVIVNPMPEVTAEAAGPICDDADPIFLVGAPAGGTWSGLGVNMMTGELDPDSTGVGTFVYEYIYVDPNGCAGTAQIDVTIEDCTIDCERIGGEIFVDANDNGCQDAGETTMVAGAQVVIWECDAAGSGPDTPIDTLVTGADGTWTYGGEDATGACLLDDTKTYTVEYIIPNAAGEAYEGYTFSSGVADSTCVAGEADDVAASGIAEDCYDPAGDDDDDNIDAGIVPPPVDCESIGGEIFVDANDNGCQDTGETTMVAGAEVVIWECDAAGSGPDTPIDTLVTGADGTWTYGGEDATGACLLDDTKTYTVEYIIPNAAGEAYEGYTFSSGVADSTCVAGEADDVAASGVAEDCYDPIDTDPGDGDGDNNIDAGIVPPPVDCESIGGEIFVDANDNGCQDTGETTMVAGAEVVIWECDAAGSGPDTPIDTLVTGADGTWTYGGEDATGACLLDDTKTYTVEYIIPNAAGEAYEGYTFSSGVADSTCVAGEADDVAASGIAEDCYDPAGDDDDDNIDAGIVPPPVDCESIGGEIFVDANDNGCQDAGETIMVAGAEVVIWECDAAGSGPDTPIDTLVTGADGTWTYGGEDATGACLLDDTKTYTVEYIIPNAAGEAYDGYNFSSGVADSTCVAGEADDVAASGVAEDCYDPIDTDPGDGDGDNNIDAGIVPPPVDCESIGGEIFVDANDNGCQDAGETTMVAGAEVVIWECDAAGSGPDTPIDTLVTGADGTWTYGGEDATGACLLDDTKTYTVEYIIPNAAGEAYEGYTFSSGVADSTCVAGEADDVAASGVAEDCYDPSDTDPGDGDGDNNIDAGIVPPPVDCESIGGEIFVDANDNGCQDASETMMVAGAEVVIWECDPGTGLPSVIIDTTYTGLDGIWTYGGADSATGECLLDTSLTYTASFSILNQTGEPYQGYTFSSGTADSTCVAGQDDNIDPGTGIAESCYDPSGAPGDNIDAGIVPPPPSACEEIGGEVWVDLNDNGCQDAGETTMVPGIEVVIWTCDPATGAPSSIVDTTYTLLDGAWTYGGSDPNTGECLLDSTLTYTASFTVIDNPSNPYQGYAFSAGVADSTCVLGEDDNVDPGTGIAESCYDPSGAPGDNIDAGIVPPPTVDCESIGGEIFVDANDNGCQDAGETMMVAGAEVVIWECDAAGAAPATPIDTIVTGTDGTWTYGGSDTTGACLLDSTKTYTVEYIIPDASGEAYEGYTFSSGVADSTCVAGESDDVAGSGIAEDCYDPTGDDDDNDIDAGIVPPPAPDCESIGGEIFVDANDNGCQDAGETMMVAGAEVVIWECDAVGVAPATPIDTIVTGTDGTWTYGGSDTTGACLLDSTKTYTVEYIIPNAAGEAYEGYTFSSGVADSTCVAGESDDVAGSGIAEDCYDPTGDDDDNDIDAGIVPPPTVDCESIGGEIFVDANDNGCQDAGETMMVAGAEVVIWECDAAGAAPATPIDTIVTGIDGTWTYGGSDTTGACLLDSTKTYTVEYIIPNAAGEAYEGYTFSSGVADSTCIAGESDDVAGSGIAEDCFDPTGDDDDNDIDAGIVSPPTVDCESIGGEIFVDANDNGCQDAGETMMVAGAEVVIWECDAAGAAPATPIDTIVTSADGTWTYGGSDTTGACLLDSTKTYTVEYIIPNASGEAYDGYTFSSGVADSTCVAGELDDVAGSGIAEDCYDPTGDDDDNDIDAGVVPPPVVIYDLAIDKSVTSTGPYSPGSIVTYQVVITNEGTEDAANITVTDSPQTGLVYSTSDAGANANVTEGTPLVFDIASLPVGGTETINLTFMIDGTFTGTTLVNDVQITADDGDDVDSDPATDDSTDENNDGDPDDDDEDEVEIPVVQSNPVYDLAIEKSVTTGTTYSPGSPVGYQIVITNQGNQDAALVQFTDTPQTGLNYLGSDAVNNPNVTEPVALGFEVASLPAGTSDTVNLIFEIDPGFTGTSLVNDVWIVQDDGDDVDSDPVTDDSVDEDGDGNGDDDDEDEVVIVISADYDLSIIKLVISQGPYAPGSTVSYGVAVTNQGGADATNVEVTDIPEAGLTYVSSDVGSNANISETSPLVFVLDSLAAGATDGFVLTFTIDAGFTGTSLTNDIQITADDGDDIDSDPDTDDSVDEDGDGDPSDDDESEATVPVVQDNPPYDLALDKAVVSSGPYSPGSMVIYTITVTNEGDVDAVNIEFTDIPQTGLNFIMSDASGNANVTELSPMLFSIASLPAGQTETVTLSFAIDATFAGTTLENQSEITLDDGGDVDSEPNNDDGDQSEDDEDKEEIAVQQSNPVYDLAIDKAITSAGPYSPGSSVTYQVVITNQGNEDAANVQFTDVPEAGLIYVSSDASGNITESSALVFDVASLVAGASDTVNLDFTIDASFTGTSLVNDVSITADDGDDIDSDPDTDDSVDEDGDGNGDDDDEDEVVVPVEQVSPEYDLAITKVLANAGPFNAGDTLHFDITVENQGDLDAAGIVVTDNSDPSINYVSMLTNANVTDNGNETFTIAAIVAGASETFTVWYEIDPSFTGTNVLNGAQITADDGDDVDSDPDSDYLVDEDGDGSPDDDDEDGVAVPVEEVVPVYDLAINKVITSTGPYSPGSAVTYQLVVTNEGDVAANNVQVVDTPQTGLNYVMSDVAGNANVTEASALTFDIGVIPVGGSETITIGFMIDGSFAGTSLVNNVEITGDDGDDVDSTPANDDGDQSEDDEDGEQINVEQSGPVYDLSINKVVTSAGPYSPGSTVTYQVTVSNDGTVDANIVEFTDSPQTGLNYVMSDASGNANVTETGSLVFEIGSLPQGQTETVMLAFMIDASFAGTSLDNDVQITADDGDDVDSDPATDDTTDEDGDGNGDDDDEDNANIPVEQPQPDYDLAIDKTVTSTGPYSPGSVVTYQVVVTNQGDVAASNVQVTDSPQTGLNYVMSDASGNANVTETGSLIFDVASLPVGGSETITLSFAIDASYSGTSLVNDVQITADDGDDIDSDPSTDDGVDEDGDGDGYDDDEAEVVITVEQDQPVYDLAIDKVVSSAGPYSPGSVVTYQVVVSNQGDVAASNVQVTDSPQTGLNYVMSDASGNANVTETGSLVFDIASLPVGGTETITLSFAIDASYSGTSLVNDVQITGDDGDDIDSDPSTDDGVDEDGDGNGDDDDEAEVAITVEQDQPVYDLAIDKTITSTGPYQTGSTVTYQVVVTNQGDVAASNVQVTDSPQTGLNYMSSDAGSNLNVTETSSLVFDVASLPVGGTATINLTFAIDASFGGISLVNDVQITGDDGDDIDSDPSTDDGVDEDGDGNGDDDDEAKVAITVEQDQPIYDLAIDKVITSSGPYALGGTVTYQITLTNQGDIDANNIQITDTPQSGLNYVMSDSGGNANVNELSSLLFEVVSLPAGQTETINVTFTIDNSFTGNSLENDAEITLDDGDDIDSNPSVSGGSDDNGDGVLVDDDEATTVITIESPCGQPNCFNITISGN